MEDQITQYIQNILQREPAPGEVDGWIAIIEGNVATLEEVRQMIIDTAEAVTNVYPMVLTYQAIYGRVPDADGLEYWTNVYASNLGLDDPATTTVNEALVEVLKPFVDPAQTPEFIDRYGANPTGDQFVAAAYQNVLNRVPDQDGLTYWQTRYAQIEASYADSGMTQDEITVQVRAEILEQFVNSAEYKTATAEEVDAYLTARAEGEDVSGSLWDLDPDANVGQTFTLTQGTDAGADFTGGDADDTFNAPVEQTGLLPIQTLNNTDDLDGMGGWNVLNAQLVNPFTIPLGLTNIQEVNIDGAPGFIVPPVTLDVLNANAIEEINFRAPINSVTINNLTTALTSLGLSDSTIAGNLFTVNHTGTATDGTADMLDINLTNNNVGSAIALTHAGGGANQGYEEITVNSMGGLGNIVAIASTNGPATLNVEGNANLNLNGSTILNVATLDTVEAGTFTGDLTATFFGTGDVDVNSGSGDDALWFATTGNVTVNGNDGDDVMTFGAGVVATATGGNGDDNFTFLALGNGNSSFTTADTVDGEEGDDSLTIFHTGPGAFLAAGVGAGIVGIETLIHDGDIADAGNNLTVDMAESGSAKTLLLQGSYDLGITTTVNNLLNDDLVILDGDFQMAPTGNLVLNYAAPGALNILNLELAGGQVTNLATMSLTEITNITSSGATANTVQNASGVEGNVVILGATDLTFGTSPANFYDFTNGVIDASGFTGDLTVGIESGLLAANIRVIGGTGDDNIVVSGASIAGGFAATIDLSVGGADTVLFNNAAVLLNNHGLVGDIHHVVGFGLDDQILFDEDGSGTPLTSTTGIAIVTDFATQFGANFFALDVAAGTNQDGTAANYVFIKFTTAVDTAGDNAATAFDEAIGLGSIAVTAGADDVLASYYDSTNSQMVLFTIDVDSNNAAGNVITQDDDIDVIATVGMSAADYAAFGFANLDVVA